MNIFFHSGSPSLSGGRGSQHSACTHRLLGASPCRQMWGILQPPQGAGRRLGAAGGCSGLAAAGLTPHGRPEHLPNPPPCRLPSMQDNALLHAIETIVIDWSHQIRDVLSKDSAQALLDGLHPLPRVEFEFWDARLTNLQCIHDQVTPLARWVTGAQLLGGQADQVSARRVPKPRASLLAPGRPEGTWLPPAAGRAGSSRGCGFCQAGERVSFSAEQAQSEQNSGDPGKSQKLLLARPAKCVHECH